MGIKHTYVTICVVVAASCAAWSAIVAGGAGFVGRGETKSNDCQAASAGAAGFSPTELLDGLCHERAARLVQQLQQPVQTVVRPPFVLAGDLPEAELQTKFATAIQPACEALLAGYFRQLPQRPVLVLMFTTEAAYREAAEQLFFDRNVSRFGYYKPGRQAILVNLSEGDGALFHELTHVLMDADFPNAPQWLQEGMATLQEAVEVGGEEPDVGLFESPAIDDSAVTPRRGQAWRPVLNWRAAVLRHARDENRLPSVQQLIRAASFRGSNEALDYAHARCFCLFLHQRGVLSRYYSALRERAETDPTGARTLLEVCAVRDWESMDLDFRVWFDAIAWEPS
jgi:hypothetical protein